MPASLVLLSASDMPNDPTRALAFKEWGLWRVGRVDLSGGKFVGFEVPREVDSSLVRQRGALRAGLMVAALLKRTLVLPSLWSAEDGGMQAGREGAG